MSRATPPGRQSAEVSESARVSVSVRQGATPDDKIEFLLRRDEETQSRLADLKEALNDLPRRWRADMEATAGTVRREQQEGLAKLRDQHLKARLGGVALLVIGLGLATWGNLLEPASSSSDRAPNLSRELRSPADVFASSLPLSVAGGGGGIATQ